MRKDVLRFACAGALALSFATATWSQNVEWQIDPDHSTASFSLLNASDPARSFNAAIAKVAGKLDFNPSKPSESTLHLNIYPAGEASLLLDRAGEFRTGALADLAKYTLLTFQSSRSKPTPDGKIEFQGNLTVIHVERRTENDWSVAYSGSVELQPVTVESHQEAAILVDLKSLAGANATGRRNADATALAQIDGAGFKQLWDAIRDSVWPLVVLDRDCRMPYYSGPSMRDYSGATCTGTPVTVAPYDADATTSPARFNDIGAGFPAPPSGNQIAIAVNLHLVRVASAAAGHPGINSKSPHPQR
ncbi:MAG: YceI family protein [Candidatus Acidiferrales bacterium]